MRRDILPALALTLLAACAQDNSMSLFEPQADVSALVVAPAPAYGEITDPAGDAYNFGPRIWLRAVCRRDAHTDHAFRTRHVQGHRLLPALAYATRLTWLIDADQDAATGPSVHGGEWSVSFNQWSHQAYVCSWTGGGFSCPTSATVPFSLMPEGVIIRVPLSRLGNDDGLLYARILDGVTIDATNSAYPDEMPSWSLSPLTTVSLTVEVAIGIIARAVSDLLEQHVLSTGEAAGLSAKMNAALASAERDNSNATCSHLRALTNQIRAFTNAGTLTVAQGEQLTGGAELARQVMVIECP